MTVQSYGLPVQPLDTIPARFAVRYATARRQGMEVSNALSQHFDDLEWILARHNGQWIALYRAQGLTFTVHVPWNMSYRHVYNYDIWAWNDVRQEFSKVEPPLEYEQDRTFHYQVVDELI